jgi:hypothetical protein
LSIQYLDLKSLHNEIKNYSDQILTKHDYRRIRKSHPNWHPAPDLFFKRTGWKGWLWFLGRDRKYISYAKLVREVRKNAVPNKTQYHLLRKLKFNNWHHSPEKYIEWVGWEDFLQCPQRQPLLSLDELRSAVLVYVLNGVIRNAADYRAEQKKHPTWASAPDSTFKNKGWQGWNWFLDKYLPLKELRNEVKMYVDKGEIKNCKDYHRIRQFHMKWHSNPHQKFKNWKNWNWFLSK